ncbi:MAG TPA: hypothetical protein VFB81_04525, partial [Myxococcales bacterium]|nr:hypothetical protein [Myxococcales bacterium]
NLYIASDDGAYVVPRGERARRVASGPFSAVARVEDAMWFAGRSGVARMDGEKLTRWGADQGVPVEQPTAISECGLGEICVGAVDGLRKLEIRTSTSTDGARQVTAHAAGGAEVTLPAQFVTAVASSMYATWVGTFDGGLVQLRQGAPLTPADGLPEGRINPRALAVSGDQAYAGTPSGLLVARGRSAALVPVGGAVSAAAPSIVGGVWLGLSGKVVRMEVEFPSDWSSLAQSRSRIP